MEPVIESGGATTPRWEERVDRDLATLIRQAGVAPAAARTIWYVSQSEGGPADLQVLLQQVTAQGWTVAHILTNGINRWTVVASKEA